MYGSAARLNDSGSGCLAAVDPTASNKFIGYDFVTRPNDSRLASQQWWAQLPLL